MTTTTTSAAGSTTTTLPPCGSAGAEAVRCELARVLPAPACASDRLPRALDHQVRATRALAAKLPTGNGRKDARLLRKIARGLRAAERAVAAAKGKHAPNATCRAAMTGALERTRPPTGK